MFEKVLKSLGMDAKDIAEITKASKEESSDFDFEPLVNKFKENQKKLYENDPELVSEITRKEQGKLLDIWTKEVRREFGLESADVKDKKFSEVIKLAKETSVKGANKDLQTLQEENLQLSNKVKDYEENQIPAIKSEVEKQKKAFVINNKLAKKIPVDQLRVPIETVDLVLNSQLSASYDLDMDDKGEIVIFGKGGKLQPKSADGTKLLTIDDIITDTLKKNKFIKESNADDVTGAGQGGRQNIQPDDKKKIEREKLPLAARKALEHADKMAAEKAAATK